VLGACERDRDERAGEREAAASDRFRERVRLDREKAPVAKLRRDVAGRSHLVEHLRRRHRRRREIELQHAP
jgi:phage terminase Nu1 subunit (DNA packaging protein)